MRIKITTFFLFYTTFLISQNPIPVQVSIPVYYQDVKYPHLQSKNLKPIGQLCGISLLFLDTSKVKEQIVIGDLNDPIIWLDKVGISTKLSFIVTDSNANVTTLDLLYSNNTCAASISRNDSIISIGNLTKENDLYAMRIIGNNYWRNEIKYLIEKVNHHLLRLHTKQIKSIPISGLFNPDSLNVILGHDYSFDTNFDLTWFDGTLRNRIKAEASMAYDRLHAQLNDSLYLDTIKTNAVVFHSVVNDNDNRHITHGTVSTIFKVESETGYLFLKTQKEYLMEIGYAYHQRTGDSGRLMINKFLIKNMENGDFIEMEVYDLSENGIPVLYVDLISGVVMEDDGAWKANEFITAIQDVFRLVKLPSEGQMLKSP